MRTEFEFINDIKSRYRLSKVGDDCAVIPKDDDNDLLITSDMLVEGVDFRLEWATPEQIGHKALAVSLSDIAAMGGTPTFALLSISVVEKLWKSDFLDGFYSGWHSLASKYSLELIGGDVSRTSGPLTIDSTVLGQVPKGGAILRSGARPGDAIYVTGFLGGAAGGLELLANRGTGSHEEAHLVEKQLQPLPQLTVGKLLLQNHLASAAIDLSDGLSSDLAHLCGASGVGAEVDADLLPIEPALASHFSTEQCFQMALNGGEDFQLLFTGDEEGILTADVPQIRRIGTVTPNTGVIELISGGKRTPLSPSGYRHF
ncbi:MAG: thiamine-phosphate kinase [Pyrinomonadaceae bacterium]